MDIVQCVNKKVYLARFKNQDKLTFNQGVTGSNPVGLTTSLTGSVEKPSQTIEILSPKSSVELLKGGLK